MTWREKLHPLLHGAKQAIHTVRPPAEGPVALTLAGGGARASFQIGALRYLYDYHRLDPDMFIGTSAGAILASLLAQHAEASDQRAALAQVEQIWSSMTSSADMFEELEWFAKLRTHLPTWMKVVSLRQDHQRTSLTQAIQARFADMFSKKEDHDVDQGTTDSKAASPMETLTTLWEGARAATDLQQIIRGYGSQNSAFRPGGVVAELLAPHVFDPVRLAAAGTTLRISVVGLESGQLRYVTGEGDLRDIHDNPVDDEPVDFIDAVTASCAIPGVFPPVNIHGEHYVDGGIRANLPTDMAYTLGAKQVIAITSGARGPGQADSFQDRDLLEIVMRTAAGIMPDELENLQVRLARAQGAIVIDPVIDVHDVLTVDPGLIAIATDYGWMRARDIMAGANQAQQQLTHDIADLRRHLWAIEDHLFGPVVDPDTHPAPKVEGDMERLGELKLHLRTLLERAHPDHLPEGGQHWWQTWEAHPYPIEARISWLD